MKGLITAESYIFNNEEENLPVNFMTSHLHMNLCEKFIGKSMGSWGMVELPSIALVKEAKFMVINHTKS
jgi:hypothetical protein